MKFVSVFYLCAGLVLANFVWRYISWGSMKGAALRGKVKGEIGQVALTPGMFSSDSVKIHVLEGPDGEPFVGFTHTAKTPLSVYLTHVKLSRPQAQELARLLELAAAPPTAEAVAPLALVKPTARPPGHHGVPAKHRTSSFPLHQSRGFKNRLQTWRLSKSSLVPCWYRKTLRRSRDLLHAAGVWRNLVAAHLCQVSTSHDSRSFVEGCTRGN